MYISGSRFKHHPTNSATEGVIAISLVKCGKSEIFVHELHWISLLKGSKPVKRLDETQSERINACALIIFGRHYLQLSCHVVFVNFHYHPIKAIGYR